MDGNWTCERCGFTTQRKDGLKTHFNRITVCEPILCDVDIQTLYEKIYVNEKNFKCDYCDKTFSFLSGKSRHKKICKVKQQQDNEKQIQELKLKLEELESKHAQTINNNNTINNNITNNDNRVTNITINAFGNENHDYLDFKDLMNDNLQLLNLIEEIHFNKEHPENWNVCISNMRSKYAQIFDGDRCIIQDKSQTIDKIIKDKCELLIENKEYIEDENRSKKMEEKMSEVMEYINSKQHHDKNKDYNERNGNILSSNNDYKKAYSKTELSLYNNKDYFKKIKETNIN
jgi:hypothetical protein